MKERVYGVSCARRGAENRRKETISGEGRETALP